MKIPFKKFFGPSTIVAAAFIGPGTVTVCTLAGVRSGYSLLWALLFSIIATIILQEMTGRLGLITRRGFGEAIRSEMSTTFSRVFSIILVLSAIVIGNAAYESGNLSGAVLGWEEFFIGFDLTVNGMAFRLTPLLIGGIAFVILYLGSFKWILNFMIMLVGIMSMVFVTTAIVISPDVISIIQGLLIPAASQEELLTVIALIGTTVVPYNLFLHASTVQEKYDRPSQLSDMRKENMVGIIIGGIISMCVVITSAGAFGSESVEIKSAADMAAQIEPLLGEWAAAFMGIGLFAAGISSAMTAPLAAAYAAKGIMGWEVGLKDFKFRMVWMVILFTGIVFSSLNINPVRLIEFAQAANGILLPLIAIFLLYIMNKQSLGLYRNSNIQNIMGAVVIIIAFLVGFKSLNTVFNFLS